MNQKELEDTFEAGWKAALKYAEANAVEKDEPADRKAALIDARCVYRMKLQEAETRTKKKGKKNG